MKTKAEKIKELQETLVNEEDPQKIEQIKAEIKALQEGQTGSPKLIEESA